MKTALLISTYNWKEALHLIFEGIKVQTRLPDEILIADDGSQEDTKQLIDRLKNEITIPVKHIWQEDNGFRKSAILNKAVAQTDADYIIQIDGDCIPEKHFIEDHISNASEGTYLFGARVNILQEHTNNVFQHQKIDFHLFSKEITNKGRVIRSKILASFYKPDHAISRKLRGCNLSYWRKDFLAINGYNEDMEGWGREDSEMAIRLHNNNLKGKRLRYCGIVFHLYHKEAPRDKFTYNDELENRTKSEKLIRCKNGIDQYLN